MEPDIDLATAAFLRLSTSPEFLELVTTGFVGTDANDSDTTPVKVQRGWLFQGLDDSTKPFRDPEGSGTSAVVVASREDWAGSNLHNTFNFPVLQVLIFCDSDRAEDGSVLSKNAVNKAKHIAKRVDAVFNTLPKNLRVNQRWGDMWVHTSVRARPMSIRDVPGTNENTVRLELYYQATTD